LANTVEGKVVYVWIHSYRSELNNKFECKNQLENQNSEATISSFK